jgi:hypothetical protein
VLPRQIYITHPVQDTQYRVTKTASQTTPCTSHAVPCYHDSFTNHTLYKPCSTMLPRQLHKYILYNPCTTLLPRQLHKSHSVQSTQYRVTKTASKTAPCTSHAVSSYQYNFTNHILYNPCTILLPRLLHNSHPVQSMPYPVTKTASTFNL